MGGSEVADDVRGRLNSIERFTSNGLEAMR
jgi:hypothetical protein